MYPFLKRFLPETSLFFITSEHQSFEWNTNWTPVRCFCVLSNKQATKTHPSPVAVKSFQVVQRLHELPTNFGFNTCPRCALLPPQMVLKSSKYTNLSNQQSLTAEYSDSCFLLCKLNKKYPTVLPFCPTEMIKIPLFRVLSSE